jgi:hypothetical protein
LEVDFVVVAVVVVALLKKLLLFAVHFRVATRWISLTAAVPNSISMVATTSAGVLPLPQ